MGPDDGRASHPYDQERAEKAVRELLLALGEDPEREGLQDTPARVARAFKENFEGLQFLVPVLSKIDGESLPLPDAGAMLPLHSGAIQYYER